MWDEKMKWFFIHGMIWYVIVMAIRQIGVEIEANRRSKHWRVKPTSSSGEIAKGGSK
jgi:hypothetical protein